MKLPEVLSLGIGRLTFPYHVGIPIAAVVVVVDPKREASDMACCPHWWLQKRHRNCQFNGITTTPCPDRSLDLIGQGTVVCDPVINRY